MWDKPCDKVWAKSDYKVHYQTTRQPELDV